MLWRSRWSLQQVSSTKPCTHLSCLSTCCLRVLPTSFILIYHLIITGDNYKSWSSSLCSLHLASLMSSLLAPHVWISVLQTIYWCQKWMTQGPVRHPRCALVTPSTLRTHSWLVVTSTVKTDNLIQISYLRCVWFRS
jgi:hypothetical protein